MIQDANVDQTERVFQASRNELVGLGRFRDSARVRVGQNHGGGVLFQCFLDDLSRVDRRSVQRALEHLLKTDLPMMFVEERRREDISLERSESKA